jgi:outer membrane lipase/esterase
MSRPARAAARALAAAAAVVVFATAGGQAVAATLFGATSLHVFGDSLSDTGRTHALTFGLAPESPPYWEGRFSDGPVWAERVEDAFRGAGLPRSNQAYGGAQAVWDWDLIPDLELQARAWRDLPSRRKGAAPMAAIAIGANDVMGAIGERRMSETGEAAADQVASTARYLARGGMTSFLLFTLPDLGRIPEYALRDDPTDAARATRGALAFNARLERRVGQLREDGLTVRVFDLFAAFGALLDDPADFGFVDATRPCLRRGERCPAAEAAGKVFFDRIHPTTAAHAVFAELILAELARPAPAAAPLAGALSAGAAPAPVPAPPAAALLLAALAGLVAAARRRGRGAAAAGNQFRRAPCFPGMASYGFRDAGGQSGASSGRMA